MRRDQANMRLFLCIGDHRNETIARATVISANGCAMRAFYSSHMTLVHVSLHQNGDDRLCRIFPAVMKIVDYVNVRYEVVDFDLRNVRLGVLTALLRSAKRYRSLKSVAKILSFRVVGEEPIPAMSCE